MGSVSGKLPFGSRTRNANWCLHRLQLYKKRIRHVIVKPRFSAEGRSPLHAAATQGRPRVGEGTAFAYPLQSTVFAYPLQSTVFAYPLQSTVFAYPLQSTVFACPLQSTAFVYPLQGTAFCESRPPGVQPPLRL